MYRKFVKRALDIIISGLALIILSPILLIVAILVRIKLGSPVLFTQERPGFNEQIFKLKKFRTMTDQCDENGKLLPDAERLVPFGKFLRKTSLDELPELWNIFVGDMSLVGPRPLLISYLPYYTEREKIRHTVRPGLTGLAQVSGRNFLEWDARLEKDAQYVEDICFWLDVKILWQTVLTVFKRENVAADTGQTEGNLAEIRSKTKI